jgi:hypothetical protein
LRPSAGPQSGSPYSIAALRLLRTSGATRAKDARAPRQRDKSRSELRRTPVFSPLNVGPTGPWQGVPSEITAAATS